MMSLNSGNTSIVSPEEQQSQEHGLYQEIPTPKSLSIVADSVQDATIIDNDDKEAKAASDGKIPAPRLDSRDYRYNWRYYVPSGTSCANYIRWFMVGGARFAEPQSEEELEESLQGLARCLLLIRKYLALFGMPGEDSQKDKLVRDQEYVLRETCRDLYSGGAPLWALEPVMQKAAEGLTGERNVNWMLFPRKAYVYNPRSDTTTMFSIERSFNICKMDAMEKVAVRLATFASNVQAVVSIPSRLPNLREFNEARGSVTLDSSLANNSSSRPNKDEEDYRARLGHEILELASGGKGLFYYVNSHEYKGSSGSSNSLLEDDAEAIAVRRFWTVAPEEKELFTRLACDEALRAIDEVDSQALRNYQTHPWLLVACRAIASAGTCAFWFSGGWWDMLVSGLLAVVVSLLGTSSMVTKQERLIYETVAGAVVGFVAAAVALGFPDDTCFGAMAIAGVLDLLQGFRVVYSIIEIMSKHTVAGVADLLEGILFTELIAYSLRIGQFSAAAIFDSTGANTQFASCKNGIDEAWYALFVPLTALAWSQLFNPQSIGDLMVMGVHGVVAYSANYGMDKAGVNVEINSFVSAMAVSFCAGILSRFTGRQAVGNTSAGMYVLVPGAYMVSSLTSWSTVQSDFFSSIISRAIAIGIGGWTGSILCSPAVLGTTRGLVLQRKALAEFGRNSERSRRRRHRKNDDGPTKAQGKVADPPATMLYF